MRSYNSFLICMKIIQTRTSPLPAFYLRSNHKLENNIQTMQVVRRKRKNKAENQEENSKD